MYVGVPGSGKTYESVSSVVIPALKSGRTVVSTIDGLTQERVDAYFKSESHGKLLPFKNEDVTDSWWSSLPPGALVVVDEAWEVLGTNRSPSQAVLTFFRMHRHFVDPDSGVSCDILLITQTATDLHKSIRDVVETSLRFVKLKAIGRADSYKVEVFLGARMRRTDISSTYIRKYDSSVFSIYKSYDAAAGTSPVEATVDDRVSIFRGNRMRFIMLGACFLLIFCPWVIYKSYRSFVPDRPDKSSQGPSTVVKAAESQQHILPAQSRSESKEGVRRLVGVIYGHAGIDLLIDDAGRLVVEAGNPAGPASTFLTETGDVLWLGPRL